MCEDRERPGEKLKSKTQWSERVCGVQVAMFKWGTHGGAIRENDATEELAPIVLAMRDGYFRLDGTTS